ncbi:DNA-binding protein [Mesotoga sp. Brook.08.105.5.1]|nr:DNA-binding protein [Mesotoga sp. Brook.08.105.5.1]RAO96959.1 DNA-binding protein [Mesotoga sp. Brook.08.YT.4.2.5.4.]
MQIEIFREARHRSGLTQKQLAERVGLSENYICAIENGRITPLFNKADRIAKELAVPVEFLFTCYVRLSRLPRFKELMYLYNLGYDISPYETEEV